MRFVVVLKLSNVIFLQWCTLIKNLQKISPILKCKISMKLHSESGHNEKCMWATVFRKAYYAPISTSVYS